MVPGLIVIPELLGDTLSAGNVLAFEPILTVDGVGLYLEDMILVTDEDLRPW